MRPKMDSDENLLRDAMRVAIPVEDPEKVAARREELLKVIGRQVALSPGRVKRSESRRIWTQGLRWSVAAAALVMAAGVGMFVQSQHRVTSVDVPQAGLSATMGVASAVDVARPAHQGESLATAVGEKQRLTLPGDTVVSVGERTGLRLIEAMPKRQVLELDYGRVDVDVTPAHGEQARYVSVRTPHAIVEVKGTIFAVEVRSAGNDQKVTSTSGAQSRSADRGGLSTTGLSTTVSVQRGLVVVHSAFGDLTLRAGDSWTSADLLPEQLDNGVVPTKESASESGAVLQNRASESGAVSNGSAKPFRATANTSRVHGVTSPLGPVDQKSSSETVLSERPSSTLAQENELFERVIVAAEAGDTLRALALCDEFLVRYPGSPLRVTVFAKRAQLQTN